MSTPQHPAALDLGPSRAGERGFTLIELLVASGAGLFVVLAAFMLSRGATRMFAGEGRVASTQLNLRIGVDRMRQDIERAGFMSTPNVRRDPDVCPDPASLGVSMRLQSLHLRRGLDGLGATDAPQSAAQGLSPDRLTVAGNFTSTDYYLAADIAPSSGGGGYAITLQTNFAATARLMQLGETGSATEAMKSVFAAGRILRVRNTLGVSQFLVIEGAGMDASNRPVITTTSTPAFQTVVGSTVVKRCGGTGGCIGCEVNPISLVEYSVRSLSFNAAFGWAYPDAGGVGDQLKYDLVRTELNPNGTEIADSQEIVAEYAVDLGFAFTVDESPLQVPGGAWIEPAIRSLPFGDQTNLLYGGDVLNDITIKPQRIRAVRYRLTTRTRIPEYTSGADNGGPGLMRYELAPGRFARARTVIGEVVIANQGGIRW